MAELLLKWGNKMDRNTVFKVKDYLTRNHIIPDVFDAGNVQRRNEGKNFSNEEHLQGLIYSLMSAQTVWANIEANLPNIDRLFFNYDFNKIKEMDSSYFIRGIQIIRCGSRLTSNQMKALHQNIATLERIIHDYGSMDNFVLSAPAYEIVEKISNPNSKYKIKQLGEALAWEYLRNVGIDGAKPDTHMKRILGSNRLHCSIYPEATNKEVFDICKKLSLDTGFAMTQIDYLFWAYCASGKGEVCTANPNCHKCVIRDECNYCR